MGTAAFDEDCARLICKADILLSLIELLKGLCIIRKVQLMLLINKNIFFFVAKQEDDEMVLQIIYVFYQISKHDSTRDYLIRETGNGNNQTLCFITKT